MAVRRHARGLLLALLLAAWQARAEPPEAEALPWYVPDHAAVQLAGSIGLLSAGPGWAFLDEQVEAGLLLGWVPRSMAGEDLIILTLKGQWHPFRLTYQGWSLRPLTVGLLLGYTLGEDYFLGLPDRYPDGYYWFSTGLRPALILGGGAGRPVPGLRLLEGYYELVATDFRLLHFLRSPGRVGTGLFSLALGVRLRF